MRNTIRNPTNHIIGVFHPFVPELTFGLLVNKVFIFGMFFTAFVGRATRLFIL
jgi:hypothetical protein